MESRLYELVENNFQKNQEQERLKKELEKLENKEKLMIFFTTIIVNALFTFGMIGIFASRLASESVAILIVMGLLLLDFVIVILIGRHISKVKTKLILDDNKTE